MKRLLLISGFVFIIAQVRAQPDYSEYNYDIDLLGKGARAAGMAYAFNAVADDATALSWNPAGIVQIKNPELAFSNGLKNTEYRHAINEYDFKPVYTVDFLGFVYPIKLKKKDLVFGVSYQNKMNLKYDYEKLPGPEGNKYGTRNLTVNTVSLSAAYSVNRFIGVGVSYNKWFSLGNKSESYDTSYEKQADQYVFARTQNFKYSGNNFTIGILLDFSTWNLPLRYTLKYDDEMWLKDDYNFTGREVFIHYDDADTTWLNVIHGIEKFRYPGTLTNGFAYRFGDYMTVAFDIDLQFFKDIGWIYDYTQNRSFLTDTVNQKTIMVESIGHLEGPFIYNKRKVYINHYNIGLEYILHPEFGFIPVRTGYKCSPTEINNYNQKGEAEKRVIANSISLGTGITLKHFSIDIAYEGFWFDRKDEAYWDEKQTDHSFILSAIWYIK